MIFVDFMHQRRLKVLGHMRSIEVADWPDLALRLAVDGAGGGVERLAVVQVAGFDWNCPQHIRRRFTDDEVEVVLSPIRARNAELKDKLLALAPGPA